MNRKIINNRYDKSLNRARKYKLDINNKNGLFIFPYEILLGTINSTENGIVNNSFLVNDFTTWNKIFVGQDNLLVRWEDCWDIAVIDEGNVETNTSGKVLRLAKIGRYFLGLPMNFDIGTILEPATIDNDFTLLQTTSTFTITTYEKITQEDMFKFYRVPQMNQKFYKISNVNSVDIETGEAKKYEITFEMINQKIASTGQAIEQFIQRAEPGGGYVEPFIEPDENKVDIVQAKLIDPGTTSQQVEISGQAGIVSFVSHGRIIKTNIFEGVETPEFNRELEAPRLLLPYKIETPEISKVNTKPIYETDYTIAKMNVKLYETFKDWQESINSKWDLTQRSKYEGLIVSSETKDIIDKRNPIQKISNTVSLNQYVMWDRNWTFEFDKIYNTSPSTEIGDTLALDSTYSLPEFLAHNYFGNKHIQTLPQSIEQNTPFRLSNIPLFGSVFNVLSLGVNYTWNNLAIKLRGGEVPMLISKSILQYGSVLLNKTEDKNYWLDLLQFTNTSEDINITASGLNSISTTLKVSLTHRFKKIIEGEDYIFDTLHLGQKHPTTDDEGKTIPASYLSENKTLLWDKTCSPTNRGEVRGYAIDNTNVKVLGKAKMRLSFFNNDIPIWSGTFKTQSLYTGNIRDIENNFKMSHWDSTNGTSSKYPEIITMPPPPNTNNPIIDINDWKGNYKSNFKDTITPILGASEKIYTGAYEKKYKAVCWYSLSENNTEKYNHIESNTKSIKEFEFDTTPYGGITNFKNNYKELEITLTFQTYSNLYQTKTFKINLAEIQGDKTILEWNYEPPWYWNYNDTNNPSPFYYKNLYYEKLPFFAFDNYEKKYANNDWDISFDLNNKALISIIDNKIKIIFETKADYTLNNFWIDENKTNGGQVAIWEAQYTINFYPSTNIINMNYQSSRNGAQTSFSINKVQFNPKEIQ